jgi:hypothetical protein
MIINQDWRKLVDAQIEAHWEDVCRRIECCLSGSEARFLEEHGTESLRSGFETSMKSKRDWVARSELPTYAVIEESLHRVIVEVTSRMQWPHGLRIPLQAIRIHFILSEVGWQIADIFEACIHCNSAARAGGASAATSARARHPPGECMFCRVTRTAPTLKTKFECKHCGGTGKCPDCGNETVPGWVRVFSLDGLKEITKRPPRGL